jgi:hypothetical protein
MKTISKKLKIKKQTPLQFIDKQKQWGSFKELILPELTNKKSTIKLKEYILPEWMSDTEIQKETNSTPINVEYFASILQNFLLKADKSRFYVFHIQLKDKIVAFNVYWSGGEWFLVAYEFDIDGWWSRGDVFLFPATSNLDTKTLDTSDHLKFKNLVSDLELLVKKYSK